MMITLTRRTGWQGSVTPMKIWLDGEKAADILENETKTVGLKKDQARLKVSHFGLRSGGSPGPKR